MSYRPSLRGPPIGGQENDRVSYLCSAPYTLSRFAGLPLKGKREVWRGKTESHIFHVPFRSFPPLVVNAVSQSPECLSCHMTQKGKSRNVLASPLGEEGHEVAKGCTRVRMIMILDVDVTAERRHYKTHCPLKGSLCIA